MHNYMAKLMALTDQARPGEVNHVVIEHDSWCEIYKDGECNCYPTVELMNHKQYKRYCRNKKN